MRPVGRSLRSSVGPLTDEHDVALLDLDGVVYVGPNAVPGVPEALATVRRRGMRLAFVTNNAARPPDVVATHLNELGIQAEADEVVTSAQAAARHLAHLLPAGSKVLVLGAAGLAVALREDGLRPVDTAELDVAAVVQGYSPDMNWQLLAEGAVAIGRGVPWVATNTDPTVPSPRGPLPGNGSFVAALRHATGAQPVVTGKPDPRMHRESVLRSGATAPIVVGDRLDTDIEGATAVGCPSLLVFSGVTGVAELLAAGPALRPDYISASLAGLLDAHAAPGSNDDGAVSGRWLARLSASGVTLTARARAGSAAGADDAPSARRDDAFRDGVLPDADALDAVRALCVQCWRAADDGGVTAVRAGDDDAERACALLELPG